MTVRDQQGATGEEDHSDSSGEEDEGGEDRLKKLEKKKAEGQASKVGRSGVSAEVYGKHNAKLKYVPRVVKKSEEVKGRIFEKLNQNLMFKSLELENKKILIDAMEEKVARKGDVVIRQGEDGDHMFLVGSGVLSCSKRFPGKSEDTFLLKYKPGDSFGE